MDLFAINVRGWEWKQLFSPSTFVWKTGRESRSLGYGRVLTVCHRNEGVTPFSEWQVIPITIAIYLATVFGIKVLPLSPISIALFSDRSKAWGRAHTLKYATAYHNMILCLWSLLMFLGGLYETINKFRVRHRDWCSLADLAQYSLSTGWWR